MHTKNKTTDIKYRKKKILLTYKPAYSKITHPHTHTYYIVKVLVKDKVLL